MRSFCRIHRTIPNPKGVRGCYGELWVCGDCKRTICAGAGADDLYPDLCDDCWAKTSPHFLSDRLIEMAKKPFSEKERYIGLH